ncbi:MAG TPA: SCO family protein [Rhodospirillales bacterium]|nr:SCO family protein [Rhodospirillales bacterium]
MNKRRLAIGLGGLGIVLAASVFAALRLGLIIESAPTDDETDRLAAAFVPPTRGVPFALVDHTGRQVTDKDYADGFMLVFFGYTFCPDVCPTELQTMSETLDLLGPAAEKVRPVFITIDPKRDTVEVLADYVEAFHPRLVGLTGTPQQIATVAKLYGAGYKKISDPVANQDGEGADDHAMGHSATLYLVAPNGRVLTTYPRGVPPKYLAEDIAQRVPPGS